MSGKLWKTLVRFPEVYKARKQGGILGLTVSRWGNSWKPPVMFPEVSNTRKRGGILGLTVSRCGNSWKPLERFPPSFQFGESRWNSRVECFQVWKPSGNQRGVSPKWKLRGNYWSHDSLWFPAGFHLRKRFFHPVKNVDFPLATFTVLRVYKSFSVISFSIKECTNVICAVLVRNKELTHKESSCMYHFYGYLWRDEISRNFFYVAGWLDTLIYKLWSMTVKQFHHVNYSFICTWCGMRNIRQRVYIVFYGFTRIFTHSSWGMPIGVSFRRAASTNQLIFFFHLTHLHNKLCLHK